MTFNILVLVFSAASLTLSVLLLMKLSRSLRELNFNYRSLEDRLRRDETNLKTDFSLLRSEMHTLFSQHLSSLQENLDLKLNQMRSTVDEHLYGTLDKRLGESFKRVDERLEQVYKGLGEMQSLAIGVGDLKRLLTNVKLRGNWGEIQLGNLLEQVLSPEQFAKNVRIRPRSSEMVDFAIKLPGQNLSEPLWLPIDSKFPQEDYLRLLEAYDSGDTGLAEKSLKQLELRLKAEARAIRDKYIHPPYTTDFAVLFLPTEGLYAEIIRKVDLLEILHRDYRVLVAGPSVLAALLNSLQMGFRTLAIQKHSSEVWKLLASIKKEFLTFMVLLEKTEKKMEEATKSLKDISDKSYKIGSRLKHTDFPQSEEVNPLHLEV
jgi:DNA recombination protein RmuC